MAQIASAAKQQRQAIKHRARNVAAMSALRTAIKKARVAIDHGSADASGLVRNAISVVDAAVTRGILKRKTASRYVSRLARRGGGEQVATHTVVSDPNPSEATHKPVAESLAGSAIAAPSPRLPAPRDVVPTMKPRTLTSRPRGDKQQRIAFLNAAAQVICKVLPTTMRPNGSGAEASNRMGRFARAVNVGVVAAPDEIRVHIHSKERERHTLFKSIAGELAVGSVQQPSGLVFGVRPAPVATDLLYLEASWRPTDFETDDLKRVYAAATCLSAIRPRF